MKALVGALIVVAHAVAFVAIETCSRGDELVIDTPPAVVATGGPGLRRLHQSHRYRGGFIREVGATQLAGPFQDPSHLACSGRVVVGQRLLDQLVATMSHTIDDELRGEDIFPVGKYQRLEHLSLRWARLESQLADAGFVGGAPHGYVRVAATVVFDRVAVPIVVALVPEPGLHFRIAAHAELAFGNRLVQWLSDKLDVDALASRLARNQIDDLLVTTLAPPPPFDLGDGQSLQFTICDGPVEIADGSYGAVPFAVMIGRAGAILPPHFAAARPPPAATSLAIDLDLDALDAMLFELWRTGWLDRRLAEVGLDRRFNTDPTAVQYLSLRISPVRLALPPVIEPGPGGTLHLGADARVAISDGDAVTTGRVFGALDFAFAPNALRPFAVELAALELACERTEATLVPCYGDLVAALRDRGADFGGALTDAFAKLLADIFVDRHVGAPGLPGELVIHGVVPSVVGGALHLELAALLQ